MIGGGRLAVLRVALGAYPLNPHRWITAQRPRFFFCPWARPHYSGLVRSLRWAIRLVLAAALAAGIGYIPLRVIGGGGIQTARRLSQDRDRLREEVEEQKRQNARLADEATALRDDPAALERVARDQMGLVREGEIVFQFE